MPTGCLFLAVISPEEVRHPIRRCLRALGGGWSLFPFTKNIDPYFKQYTRRLIASCYPPALLSHQMSHQLSEVCVKGNSVLMYAVEAGLAVMVDAVASHFWREQV